jgi:hypothetical protein
LVVCGIGVELQPTEPIFEKCPHLREKGGVLTLRTPHWVCADPYSKTVGFARKKQAKIPILIFLERH